MTGRSGGHYYVSFDNFHVGELKGQMIVDGLKAEGKDPRPPRLSTSAAIRPTATPSSSTMALTRSCPRRAQAGFRDAGRLGRH